MIHPHLAMSLAQGRVDDLRSSASRHLPQRHHRRRPRLAATQTVLTLRLATPSQDDHVIARLAALDSSSAPASPVLLAFVEGEPRAALSLTDGKVIADPFHHTAELVDLLRARARQLVRSGRMRQPARSRLLLGHRAGDRLLNTPARTNHDLLPLK